MLKSRFSSKKCCFLVKNMNGKLRKKCKMFLSVVSIYNLNFKIFHQNHDEWKNNTEIAKIWNFRAENSTILMWYQKSAKVRLFCMSPTTTLCWSPFCARQLFFVTLCYYQSSWKFSNLWNYTWICAFFVREDRLSISWDILDLRNLWRQATLLSTEFKWQHCVRITAIDYVISFDLGLLRVLASNREWLQYVFL